MTFTPRIFPTVVEMLADAARNRPEAEALVCEGDRLSYAGYAAAVAGLSEEFRDRGLAGARIALILPNSADFAVALFAALAAGAQTAPLNPLYTEHELEGILSDCAPDLILVSPEARDGVARVAQSLGLAPPEAVGPGARRLIEAPAGTEAASLPLPDADAPGILQYTGGTTGRPKGVEITHRASAVNVSQRQAVVPVEAADRLLVMTPLYHVYASSMGLFAAAYAGACLVILPTFTAARALETITEERISFLAGSPTIYHALLASEGMDETDFSRLALCFSGASALPSGTLAEWERRTGSIVCEGFGQTETGPVLASNPRTGRRKMGSVGVLLPETEVQIVDPVEGRTVLPAGEQGEIRARGPQMMRGYRNLPDETAKTLRDGWVHTGDIGYLDAEGYLFITDRKKDMVIVSGFNVYPREIEEALYTCPGVVEAAAFGVPHPRKGEAIRVHAVAPGRTPEVLAAHLAERLARYKQPSDIRIVPELPKTAVGKIDKAALRREAAAAPLDPAKTGPSGATA